MIDDLSLWQVLLLFSIFIWSGFVRTALGFGGVALSIPLFLLLLDSPVEILPIIGIHLLIAVIINCRHDYPHIDWHYLKKTLPFMMPFKIAGVIGLLSLPADILNIGVYCVTSFYALSYIFPVKWKIDHPFIDLSLLATGAYISGTSLIGAPLIIAVFTKHVAPSSLRSTLFALWFILVSIKLLGFVITGTDLQIEWAIYTLPFAVCGQYLGNIAHRQILTLDKSQFMKWIGSGLLLICLLGLIRTFMD